MFYGVTSKDRIAPYEGEAMHPEIILDSFEGESARSPFLLRSCRIEEYRPESRELPST